MGTEPVNFYYSFFISPNSKGDPAGSSLSAEIRVFDSHSAALQNLKTRADCDLPDMDDYIKKFVDCGDAERFATGELQLDSSCVAVYLPNEDYLLNNNVVEKKVSGVYGSPKSAKDVLKPLSKEIKQMARFKTFNSYETARRFADTGSPPKRLRSKSRSNLFALDEERPLPFSQPQRAQLVQFKKLIEARNYEEVQVRLLANPRLLIDCSAADKPTVIHDGQRFNPLHIASNNNAAEICGLILHLVNNREYVARLYPDDSEQMNIERTRTLREAYLRMPDCKTMRTPLHWAVSKCHFDVVKVLCRYPEASLNAVDTHGNTALHLAAEKGLVEILRFLCSFPNCDRSIRNLEGKTPRDLALSCNSHNVSNQLLSALDQKLYYVHLLRDIDYVKRPKLSQPSLQPQLDDDQLMLDDSSWFLAATIGPCNLDVATQLHREWNSSRSSLKRTDLHKGFECVGRELALGCKAPWKECWPILDAMVDLSSDDGLDKLECYMKTQCMPGCSSTLSASEDFVASPYAPFKKRRTTSLLGQKSNCAVNGIGKQPQAVDNTALNEKDTADVFCDSFDVLPGWNDGNDDDVDGNAEVKLLAKEIGALRSDCVAAALVDDEDPYRTPPSSPVAQFIVGSGPTKLDLDILKAIGEKSLAKIVAQKHIYPCLHLWLQYIKWYQPEERMLWPGLDSPRARSKRVTASSKSF